MTTASGAERPCAMARASPSASTTRAISRRNSPPRAQFSHSEPHRRTTMKRTITAMFDSYHDAVEAVRRLEGAGIPHADISIVSNDPANRDRLSDAPATTATGRRSDATDSDDAASGAGTGASLGA